MNQIYRIALLDLAISLRLLHPNDQTRSKGLECELRQVETIAHKGSGGLLVYQLAEYYELEFRERDAL